jgi:hypothetical protein
VSDPFHEGKTAARARRLRSWAIAIMLLAFVVLTFIVTIAKMAGNIAHHAPS